MSEATNTADGVEAALLAAQAEFPEIPKDKENTYYKTKYSSLDAIVSASRPALVKHGLLLTWSTEDTATGVKVTARLFHTQTKTKLENALSADCARTNVQQIGIAITYLRRYTCAPLLGITSDEDEDGNGAVDPPGNDKAGKRNADQKTPEAKAPAQPNAGNCTPPRPLDKMMVEDFYAWIDKQNTAAELRVVLGHLLGYTKLYNFYDEWHLVFGRFVIRMSFLWKQANFVKDDALATQVKDELAKLDVRKKQHADLEAASKETFCDEQQPTT